MISKYDFRYVDSWNTLTDSIEQSGIIYWSRMLQKCHNVPIDKSNVPTWWQYDMAMGLNVNQWLWDLDDGLLF